MHGIGGWTADIAYQPYLGAQIGAPPPLLATPGRLNRSGVSFLYLATDENTAAAEIRPHPGHLISLAPFRAVKEVMVADFSAVDIADFAASDERLDLFHLIYTIGREISEPVPPEDRQRYTVTQLVADLLRRQRYDAIRYPSSVASGANLCVFRPALFQIEPAKARIVQVKTLKYSFKRVAHLIEPTDEDKQIS
jgi:RES domain-containing protein